MGVLEQKKGPKVLCLDIETAPILAHVWKIWDENIGLNQIVKDWHVLSWAAKWYQGKDGTVYGPHNKMMYMDQRKASKVEDDKTILKGIWQLIDEADIVITQNGVSFDMKKLNARFLLNGFPPPSSYKNIDTKLIASHKFGLTSNGLEYMSNNLCDTYKKLKHGKYPGFELWSAVLTGKKDAWEEMEKYNKHDVLALEELARKLLPWDNRVNFSLYTGDETPVCSCGSTEFKKNGFHFTAAGKFQRWKCSSCHAESRSRGNNLLSKEKVKSLRASIAK